MTTLQQQIEQTRSNLALHTDRVAILQKALKNSLINTATSPAALISAFGIGAVLGRNQQPSESLPHAPSNIADHAALKGLLGAITPLLNWSAFVPVIIGLWRELNEKRES